MSRRPAVLTVFLAGVFAGQLTPAPARELPPHSPKPRQFQVLYIEGTPRWEYRYHRAVLDHRTAAAGKPFEHNVVLFDADGDYIHQDPKALATVPAGANLDHFDLVILGDVDPKDDRIAGPRTLDLARYVQDGGRLLVIAGPRHVPHDLKGTALEAVLPIELAARPAKKDGEWKDGYRPAVTAAGRKHPAFQFDPDETVNAKVWDALPEMYWWAEGYRARAGAEVLATHPRADGKGAPHPLVVWHKVEKGRCGFVGFDETWRWRKNDGERHHQTFWAALWRSLAAR